MLLPFAVAFKFGVASYLECKLGPDPDRGVGVDHSPITTRECTALREARDA
jgi:hypothetical protein